MKSICFQLNSNSIFVYHHFITIITPPRSWNFLCCSPVAVARSTSGSVAICYALPVLWIVSHLATVGCMAIHGLSVSKCSAPSGIVRPGQSLMPMIAFLTNAINKQRETNGNSWHHRTNTPSLTDLLLVFWSLWINEFYYCMSSYASAVLTVVIPSVRTSVTRMLCDKNQTMHCRYFDTTWVF